MFGSLPIKELAIPYAIDAYNHHMGGIDTANQIRSNFTYHLRWEQRTWRPSALWCLDVAVNNSYIIWKLFAPPKVVSGHREHEFFEKRLIAQLLSRGKALGKHTPENFEKTGYCAWGAKHPEACHPKAQTLQHSTKSTRTKRSVCRNAAREVPGDKKQRIRARQVKTGCKTCDVHLCTNRGCFSSWHVSIYQNLV